MSQLLVVFLNNTNGAISFVNQETESDNQNLDPSEMFRTQNHFNIPDCSSQKYFAEHHMEVRDGAGNVLFSFWDNDHEDYKLMCCIKNDYTAAKDMLGYNDGGNNATVGIVVSGSPGNYSIMSHKVLNNV